MEEQGVVMAVLCRGTNLPSPLGGGTSRSSITEHIE